MPWPPPVSCGRNTIRSKRLEFLSWRARIAGLHEAIYVSAVRVCDHELGCHRWTVLLRHRKERRLVERQVLTHPPVLKRLEDRDYLTPLEVEVIRDLEGFNSIAKEWDRLADRWAIDRVFLSHAWFRTWWEAFGMDNQLHIVVVRSNGRLVGAAPLMCIRLNICGFRANAFHAIYNPHTPRYDFIIGDNQDARLYEAIWNSLINCLNCDVIVLAQVPDTSRTVAIMEELATRHGWQSGQWIPPASPFIRLNSDYESYFNALSRTCRFNLTKRYVKLRRRGPIDVEIVRDRDAVEAAMADGLRIEAAAWKGREGTAILSDPAVSDFYVQLAKREADLGQLRLTFLRAGGKRIAFNYILQNDRKLYAVKIGYDPEYHAYSPGNMLLNLILKDACQGGIEEYDLLGGDDDWKFEWTKEVLGHRWLFLFRDRFRPRLLHRLKFEILPVLRKWGSLRSFTQTV